jgi:predicted transport protein
VATIFLENEQCKIVRDIGPSNQWVVMVLTQFSEEQIRSSKFSGLYICKKRRTLYMNDNKKRRLIDIPVGTLDDEFLGFKDYAEVLADFIMSTETPITIGIQGDWGIGKTSLLNLIKEKLLPSRGRQAKYHVIYFNTWQYSQFNQEEFLGLSILKGIINEILQLENFKDSNNSEEFKQSIKRFGKFVGALGNQVIKRQVGLDIENAIQKNQIIDHVENDLVLLLSKTKEEFQRLVKALIVNENDKLVVLIDDLDRIRPVKALEFLESIKNFLDVEYCVFVIAVDYSVIQTGMTEKLGRSAQELQGKSYFDKIIQIPFSMPVSSYAIDKYIMSLLGWEYENKKFVKHAKEKFFLKIKDNSLSDEDAEYFTNITRLTVGANPRSIKRAVNYSNLLKMIVEMKRKGSGKRWTLIDAKILYPLTCIQLAYPELFQHFAENPAPSTIHLFEDFDHLSKLKDIDVLFKRVHNPEEVKSNITGFFDEFITLIDINGDGEINAEEFKPIWEMMRDANLTNSKLKDADEDWQILEKMILKNQGAKEDKALVKSVLELFVLGDSKWRDPIKFSLLNAGKKFYNVMWDKKQLGSFVTTQKEPIQFYLKIEYEKLCLNFSDDEIKYFSDVKNVGHYGSGDTKVHLIDLVQNEKKFGIINKLHEFIMHDYALSQTTKNSFLSS